MQCDKCTSPVANNSDGIAKFPILACGLVTSPASPPRVLSYPVWFWHSSCVVMFYPQLKFKRNVQLCDSLPTGHPK